MTKEFRVTGEAAKEPIMLYRYSMKEQTLHGLKELPSDFQTLRIKTEHQFINEWSDFAKSAFLQSPVESNLPCWEGHYEQFGRVMLQVLHLCNARSTRKGQLSAFIDAVFTERSDFAEWLCEITGTEEREWYRAWFSLLGHPDYLRFELESSIHTQAFMHKKFMLSFASYEFYDTLPK